MSPPRETSSAVQGASASGVLAASWCRSVGTTWTVELRSVSAVARPGPVVEWICSGVPTQFPAPDHLIADLLGERDLLLFPEDPDDPVEREPRTRSRRLIGYVTRDPELVRLALMLADATDEGLTHPMLLAGQWVEAGYSPEAAASWVAAGVTWAG